MTFQEDNWTEIPTDNTTTFKQQNRLSAAFDFGMESQIDIVMQEASHLSEDTSTNNLNLTSSTENINGQIHMEDSDKSEKDDVDYVILPPRWQRPRRVNAASEKVSTVRIVDMTARDKSFRDQKRIFITKNAGRNRDTLYDELRSFKAFKHLHFNVINLAGGDIAIEADPRRNTIEEIDECFRHYKGHLGGIEWTLHTISDPTELIYVNGSSPLNDFSEVVIKTVRSNFNIELTKASKGTTKDAIFSVRPEQKERLIKDVKMVTLPNNSITLWFSYTNQESRYVLDVSGFPKQHTKYERMTNFVRAFLSPLDLNMDDIPSIRVIKDTGIVRLRIRTAPVAQEILQSQGLLGDFNAAIGGKPADIYKLKITPSSNMTVQDVDGKLLKIQPPKPIPTPPKNFGAANIERPYVVPAANKNIYAQKARKEGRDPKEPITLDSSSPPQFDAPPPNDAPRHHKTKDTAVQLLQQEVAALTEVIRTQAANTHQLMLQMTETSRFLAAQMHTVMSTLARALQIISRIEIPDADRNYLNKTISILSPSSSTSTTPPAGSGDGMETHRHSSKRAHTGSITQTDNNVVN